MRYPPAELQAAVRKGVAVDVFADKATRDLVLRQDDPLALEGERQLRADIAFVAQAKDIAQPVWRDVHGPVQVVRTARNLANRALYRAMNPGRKALAASMSEIPASRSSLTNRSCNVRFARSTRPLA